MVNAYPDILESKQIKEIIENTLENFRINQIAEVKDIKENFYRSLAKSSAIKYGQILTKLEMIKLVEELLKLNEYTYSPSGKRIIREINRDEMASFFKK